METTYRTGLQRFRERYPDYPKQRVYLPLLQEEEVLGVGTMMEEDINRLEEKINGE